MNISFVLVNYNNSEYTLNCIKSIRSIKICNDNINIYVVDNNSSDFEKTKLKKLHNVKIFYLAKNIGYFPGINIALNEIDASDYVIISNNDIHFKEDFIENLRNIILDPELFVISPRITTINGIDQNPHEIYKIGRLRQMLYIVYFWNFYIGQIMYVSMFLFRRLFKKPNRVNKKKAEIALKRIYMGFGACFVLTPFFINKISNLPSEIFLMGEEYLLSNVVYKNGGRIDYNPGLKVVHYDNKSISKLTKKSLYIISKNSFLIYKKIIRNKYF
jgi:GT2 family glycosyltransferase